MLKRQEMVPPSSRSRLYDSESDNESHNYDSEEEEEDDDEHEEERLLSEAYGEAEEGGRRSTTNINVTKDSNNKKKWTDAEIASALNQEESKKKRIKRTPVLDASTLTGPKGLITIRHAFRSYKYKPPPVPSNKLIRSDGKGDQENMVVSREREITAAANYLSTIMRAYQDFATRLCPTEHYSNTFYKIQQLGSKKEVRDYLNSMRDDMAREYLESIYGREKAEKYLHELEHGLKVNHLQHFEKDQKEDDVLHEQNDLSTGAGAGTMRLAAIQALSKDTEEKDDMGQKSEMQEEPPGEEHQDIQWTNNNTHINALKTTHPMDQEESEDEQEMDFDDENLNPVQRKQNIEKDLTWTDDSRLLDSSKLDDNDNNLDNAVDHADKSSKDDEEEEEEHELDISNMEKEDNSELVQNSQEIQENHEQSDHKDVIEEDNVKEFIATPFELLGQTQDEILQTETETTQDTLVVDSSELLSATQETFVATMSPTQDGDDILEDD